MCILLENLYMHSWHYILYAIQTFIIFKILCIKYYIFGISKIIIFHKTHTHTEGVESEIFKSVLAKNIIILVHLSRVCF